MVIVFEAHAAVTPAGRPVAAPMPVAPTVVWVMVVTGVLTVTLGVEEAAPAVLTGLTVMVPVALTGLHPFTNGIL
jgi:hypothetical protein